MTNHIIERSVAPILTPLSANRVIYEDDGGFYLRRFESTTTMRVCAGCGTKAAICPTWGVCDWASFSDEGDVLDDLTTALPASD